MIYLAIGYSVLLTILFAFIVISDRRERSRLIEMLIAKDYADFKNFEQPGNERPRERKDMFAAREAKMKNKNRAEQE